MKDHRTTTLSRTAIICVLLSCISFNSTTTKDKSIFENNVKNIICDALGCGHLPPNPKYEVPIVAYNCGSSLEQATCSSDTSVRARPRQPDSFLGTPTLEEYHKEYKDFPLYNGVYNTSMVSLPIKYTVLHRYPKAVSFKTESIVNSRGYIGVSTGRKEEISYTFNNEKSITRSEQTATTIGKSLSFSKSLGISLKLLLDIVTLGIVSSLSATAGMSRSDSIVKSYSEVVTTGSALTISSAYTNLTGKLHYAGYEQRYNYTSYLYEEYDISYTNYLINRSTSEGTFIGRIPTYTLSSTNLIFEERSGLPYTMFMAYEDNEDGEKIPLISSTDVHFVGAPKEDFDKE